MYRENADSIFLETFSTWYMEWMVRTMHGDKHRILFDILHNMEFKWNMEWDEHRASDGRNLRNRFASESESDFDMDDATDWPCSVLEMLVALAYSIEDTIMYDYEKGDRTHIWFWTMMRNIGLDFCTDEWMMQKGKDGVEYIDDVWRKVAERRYEANGCGGLFPLKEPAENQQDVELWFQANAYFIENAF